MTTDTTNCPKCDSSRLQYEKNYGYWECQDCGHFWAIDADDPDYDEEPLDFGNCCACDRTGQAVRNLTMLGYKTPIPGTGWGCFVCQLPSDGAVAVVCDECVDSFRQGKGNLKFAILGYPTEKRRIDISQLKEPFSHLDIPHD